MQLGILCQFLGLLGIFPYGIILWAILSQFFAFDKD